MHSGFILNRFSDFTGERPSLDQFVLLSLLLHALVIVLFGDTSGGGARRGEKLWGALTVTVEGLLPGSATGLGLKLDRGATLLQPPGAAARPAPASPGTTRQNREARPPAPAEIAPPAEEAPPPAQAPSFEMPPLISKATDKPATEFVVPKPSIDRAFAPATPAPPTEQAPRETPAVPPLAVPPPVIAPPVPEPVAPPMIERALVAPAPIVKPEEVKPREENVAPPAPAPKAELIPPKIERDVVKPVVSAPEPKPREVIQQSPPTPVAPVAPPPPKPEREIVQQIAPAADSKPRELPAAPPIAPPTVNEPPRRAEAPKIEREVVTPPAPSLAAPPRAPVGTPTGTPNADNDIFKPRGGATTPSTEGRTPGNAPGIDLEAVRRRAREITGGGGGARTMFPFPVAPPPKPKSREQQAFDKALKKNDCRDAYAGLGLAAVVPLVLDAVREDGCRW